MVARFKLFGAKGLEISEVAQLIAESLGLRMDLRESSYKGGEYFICRDESGAEITVERNALDEEGIRTEPEFSEYETLVYLNYGQVATEQVLSEVRELKLLRSETV